MRRILAIILAFITLSFVTGCGEVRREPVSKQQERGGVTYIVNEQTPYTGIVFVLYGNGQLESEKAYRDGVLNGVSKKWSDNGQLKEEMTFEGGRQDGICKFWHDNGQLESEVTYKNGERYGVAKKWNSNGQLKEELTFKADRQDGICKFWHDNGQLESEVTYKNGERYGVAKKWNSNGQLKEELTFKADRQDGICKFWHDNGQLESEVTYKNGERYGIAKKWNSNGQLKEELTFKADRQDGICKFWHDNGQLESEVTYKNGERYGIAKKWNSNGQLKEELTFKADRQDGICKFWHDNSQLQSESTFKDGQLDGGMKTWHDNGQLQSEMVYKSGKRFGACKWWHDNSQLQSESTFKDGQLDGGMKTWYANGQLESEKTYKAGNLDGSMKTWYDNGQLKEVGSYKAGLLDGICKTWYENGQPGEVGSYKAWLDENGQLIIEDTLQIDVTPPPTVEANNAVPLDFLGGFAHWLLENNKRLVDYNDFEGYENPASRIHSIYAKLGVSSETIKLYLARETPLKNRFSLFETKQYDFSMLPTPKSWEKQGIIFQTICSDKLVEFWFTDANTFSVEKLNIPNEGIEGIMSNYKEDGLPEIIQVQDHYECCNSCYYISEVASTIRKIHLDPFIETEDKEFAHFDDDCQIVYENASWTGILRHFPSIETTPVVYTPTALLNKIGFIWGDNVNVRAKGGENYKKEKVLYQLNRGDKVRIKNQAAEWYEITSWFGSNNASSGWVIQDYLKNVPPPRMADKTKIEAIEKAKIKARIAIGKIEETLRKLSKLIDKAVDLGLNSKAVNSVDVEKSINKLLQEFKEKQAKIDNFNLETDDFEEIIKYEASFDKDIKDCEEFSEKFDLLLRINFADLELLWSMPSSYLNQEVICFVRIMEIQDNPEYFSVIVGDAKKSFDIKNPMALDVRVSKANLDFVTQIVRNKNKKAILSGTVRKSDGVFESYYLHIHRFAGL